ncbi:MAG: M56 family metallopeptidase [Tannerella sp.]|jgi:TonB family protein|nr:M56 family metallopeptidase [Tannerella sp.]
MGILLAFSLKSALCLTLFYTCYKALLSRETFHRFNRTTLLSLIALSLCIPLLAALLRHAPWSARIAQLALDPAVATLSAAAPPAAVPSPAIAARLWAILSAVYPVGCLILILRLLRASRRIARLIRRSKCSRLDRRIRLAVHTDDSLPPFSWMNCIVLSEKDMAEAADIIIAHEQAHIRNRHAADLLCAQLCLVFQWYNPAAWLIYEELQNVHEYEADRSVIDRGINAKQYQLLLIKKAVGTRLYALVAGLNHSNLKKRIAMMLQKNSNSWARLKYTFLLPLAAVATAALAHPGIARPFDEISRVKVAHLVPTANPVDAKIVMETDMPPLRAAAQPGDSVYQVVDELPAFPGGNQALLSFIRENLRYPQEAWQNGIQGRVILSFIVRKDGKLSDVTVVREVSPELDAEAVRVLKSMPDWTPGKLKGEVVSCKYTIPINFHLSM